MPVIHVAVGIIFNEKQEVLLAFRDHNKHQGGLWEFPGGKVEPGESLESALKRELAEELGLVVSGIKPLLKIEYDYGDKHVLLDTWEVSEYQGEARGKEGQAIKWAPLEELENFQFPAANWAIVNFLTKQQTP